jgi:hypothetical protein
MASSMTEIKPTQWGVTPFSCVVPKQVGDIVQLYMLALDKEKIFRNGAKSFMDFKPKTGDIWLAYMQLFFKFGEELVNTLKLKLKGSEAAQKGAFGGYIEIYFESVVADPTRRDNAKYTFNMKNIEFSAYQFYIAVRDPDGKNTLNGNAVFSELLASNEAEFIKKKKSNDTYRGRKDDVNHFGLFEKWKMVGTVLKLSDLYDVYTGHAAANKVIDVAALESPSGLYQPLTAETCFAPDAAGWALGDNSHYDQSVFNWQHYIRDDTVTKKRTITFTRRKFVQRIPLGDMSVMQMTAKMFPELQLNTTSHMSAILPVILSDYEERITLIDHRLKADMSSYLKKQRKKGKVGFNQIVDPRPARLIADDWLVNDMIQVPDNSTLTDEHEGNTGVPMYGHEIEDNSLMRDRVNRILFDEDEDEDARQDLSEGEEFEKGTLSLYQNPDPFGSKRSVTSAYDTDELITIQSKLNAMKLEVENANRIENGNNTNNNNNNILPENRINRVEEVDGVIVYRKTKQQVLEEIANAWNTLHIFTKNPVPFTAEDLANTVLMATKKNNLLDMDDLSGVTETYMSAYGELAIPVRKNTKALLDLYSLAKKKKGDLISRVQNIEVVMRKLILMRKIETLKKYIQNCRAPDTSKISIYERSVLQYIHTHNLYDTPIQFKKFDKSLSVFANWEINQYMMLDAFMLIAYLHLQANLSLKYSWDAWREDFDLHCHMFTISKQGGVGKSFIWELLKKRSIPGTVEEESDRSEKSEATSERNRNGRVVIMHELNKRLIMEDKKGTTSDKERQLKELITSNRNRTRRLVKMDDGSYRQDFTDSECITVYLGSSNLNVINMMSDAFRSRIDIHYVEERIRPGDRSIMQLKLAEATQNMQEKDAREKCFRDSHLLQAMFMEIERLIFLEVLSNVSMHVAMVVLLIVDSRLAKAGAKRPNPRDYMRTLFLARINCILTAIIKTFFIPSSKFYGKTIDPHNFLYLDRRLFCTPEHIVAAIGEHMHQYVDTDEDAVISAIAKYFEFTCESKSGRFKAEFARTQDPVSGKLITTEIRDPTYIRIRKHGSFENFADKLSQITRDNSGNGDKPCLSSHTVEKTLKDWKDKRIRGRKYREHPEDPELVIEDLESSETEHFLMLEDQYAYYFYSKLFYDTKKKSGRDVLIDIIKFIFSRKGQREIPYRFIFDNDPKFPYIRNFIVTGQEEEEREREDDDDDDGEHTEAGYLAIPTAATLDSFAKSILGLSEDSEIMAEAEYRVIDCDLATYGIVQHLGVLFVGDSPINPDFLSLKSISSDFNTIGENDQEQTLDEYGIPNDDYYDAVSGYYLGVPFNIYKKHNDSAEDIEYTRNQLVETVKDLDAKPEDLERPDFDFDVNDFVVERKEDGTPVYHWDLLGDSPMADPIMYKKMWVHPLIDEDFINRCYGDSVPDTSDYPEGYKQRAEEKRQKILNTPENFCNTDEQVVEAIENGHVFLTVDLDKKNLDEFGKPTLKRKKNSPFTAVVDSLSYLSSVTRPRSSTARPNQTGTIPEKSASFSEKTGGGDSRSQMFRWSESEAATPRGKYTDARKYKAPRTDVQMTSVPTNTDRQHGSVKFQNTIRTQRLTLIEKSGNSSASESESHSRFDRRSSPMLEDGTGEDDGIAYSVTPRSLLVKPSSFSETTNASLIRNSATNPLRIKNTARKHGDKRRTNPTPTISPPASVTKGNEFNDDLPFSFDD